MTARRSQGRWRDTLVLYAGAVALRAMQMGRPLWKDEQITVRFVDSYGPIELLHIIPRLQPHFPPYYLLLDAIQTVTGTVVAGRWLSLAAGALVPVVAYHWLHSIRSRQVARAVGGLLAVSPVLVMQSYWLRMYALLSLAVVVSWWLAWEYLHGGRAWPYLLAALSVVTLHPFGFVVASVQLGWLTIEQYRSGWRRGFRALGGGVVVAVAVVVGVLAVRVIFQVPGFGPVYDLHPSYASMPVVRAVVLPVSTVTGTHYTPLTVALAGLVSGGLALQAVRARYWQTKLGRLTVCWIGGSMLLLLGAQAVRPVLQLKYVAWLAVPVAVLAVDLDGGRGRLPMVMLAALAVLGLFLGVIEGKTVSRVAIYDSGVLQKL